VLAGYLGAYHDSTGFASGLLFQVALELQQVGPLGMMIMIT
jgi:hypothetical protein